MYFCFTEGGFVSSLANPADLDQFDLAILDILQRDNTTPQRVIGEAVNLSAPSVQRRIRRMEESGVIKANVSIINPGSVGCNITVLVEVEVVTESAELIEAAKQSFATCPQVQQCYYITGNTDFFLVMLVATMAEYEQLTKTLFFGNNNVKRFRTTVVMDRVKIGMTVSPPDCTKN